MDRLEIVGGARLQGQISISGAKNASLPILAATLLSSKPLHLTNLPNLADIVSMVSLIKQHGCEVAWDKSTGTITLNTQSIESSTAPYEMVRKMRASVLVLGPLLARCGHAEVSLPGGCAIGSRPVDIHIKGLEKMGSKISIEDGYIKATTPNGLHGAEIIFPFPSVGATENILMAATLSKGKTIIRNAACEPEIVDLAHCLIAMGARISGHGTNCIEIEGVTALSEATHAILPDRIETGTYVMAAGITGGELLLENTNLSLLAAAIPSLEEMGLIIQAKDNGIYVKGPKILRATDITTAVYPGYATDLQAQIMALMSVADGVSVVHETIFENRFMHVPELRRLGAKIEISEHVATIKGMPHLKGAEVMATDLRASVALVLAALVADGQTVIHRLYHLDRGYEFLDQKLANCGANIIRKSTPEDQS